MAVTGARAGARRVRELCRERVRGEQVRDRASAGGWSDGSRVANVFVVSRFAPGRRRAAGRRMSRVANVFVVSRFATRRDAGREGATERSAPSARTALLHHRRERATDLPTPTVCWALPHPPARCAAAAPIAHRRHVLGITRGDRAARHTRDHPDPAPRPTRGQGRPPLIDAVLPAPHAAPANARAGHRPAHDGAGPGPPGRRGRSIATAANQPSGGAGPVRRPMRRPFRRQPHRADPVCQPLRRQPRRIRRIAHHGAPVDQRRQGAARQRRRQARQVAGPQRSQRVVHDGRREPRPDRLEEPLLDLALEHAGTAAQAERVEPVQRGDRGDPVAGGEQDDVVEGRLAPGHGRAHPRGGREQLGREGVGLDLARVRRVAGERLVRVDRDCARVTAADVAELVREREALAHDGLRAVDPQHDALAVAPAAAGDALVQRGDDHRQPEIALDRGEHAGDAGPLVQPQRGTRLTRALGADIRVPARHRRHSGSLSGRMRSAIPVLLVLAALGAVAGCGGSDSTSGESATSTGAAAQTATTSAPAATTRARHDDAGQRDGGHLETAPTSSSPRCSASPCQGAAAAGSTRTSSPTTRPPAPTTVRSR